MAIGSLLARRTKIDSFAFLTLFTLVNPDPFISQIQTLFCLIQKRVSMGVVTLGLRNYIGNESLLFVAVSLNLSLGKKVHKEVSGKAT